MTRQRVGVPMQCPDLGFIPENSPGLPLSQDMQQAIALLLGYWRSERIPIRCSPSGMLFTGSPQLDDIFHVTATSDNFAYQGTDKTCSVVMVMGHPSNTGKVWVRSKSVATVDNAWPLAKGEVIQLTLTNLHMLHLLIATDTEKAIIAYAM